jgi:hypothetical protein
MPTGGEYKDKIRHYPSHGALLELWEKIMAGTTAEAGWEAGKAFEYLVIRAFELEGAEVTYPYTVKGVKEQIDGAVYTGQLSCLIESKDQLAPIAIEPIAKLRNQLLRRPSAATGIVFASHEFSEQAILLAQYMAPQAILLWTGVELKYALEHRWILRGLIQKHRHLIEHGLPDLTINTLGDQV